MSWFFTNLISAFLLPPLNLLIIFLLGLALWRKRPIVAKTMIAFSFVALWLSSTPLISEFLLRTLETSPAISQNNEQTAEAIVVLGGGTYVNAPEYAGDTVSSATLERLRYAAKLYHKVQKPILLAGGNPLGTKISEAQLMKSVLELEFNTQVAWTEDNSNNTFESAHLSYQLLQKSGIKRIYLITHAWHMPRSIQAFEAAGFEVIPAATAYTTRYHTNLLAFLPSAGSLQDSQIFLHEVIGMLWYRLKS
jgi:uncharacterized SAM-binding protein YcdF (DUF218 family)